LGPYPLNLSSSPIKSPAQKYNKAILPLTLHRILFCRWIHGNGSKWNKKPWPFSAKKIRTIFHPSQPKKKSHTLEEKLLGDMDPCSRESILLDGN